MARDFTKNISNLMTLPTNTLGPLINGASQVLVAGWVTYDSLTSSGFLTNDNGILQIIINASTLGIRFGIADEAGDGLTGTLYCVARAANGETGRTVEELGLNLAAGTLYHLAVIVDFANDTITLYINGASPTGAQAAAFTSTAYTNAVPSTNDRIAAITAVTTGQLDGRLSELCVYKNVGAETVVMLAKGFSPQLVRPDKLVWYLDLRGRGGAAGPERDLKAGTTATIAGTIAIAGHPRIFNPAPMQLPKATQGEGVVAEVDWSGSGVFETLKGDLVSGETFRGRDYNSQLTGRAGAGQARLSLFNFDGKYSSFKTSSPLYGLIKPRRKVRIRWGGSAPRILWTGFLDSIEPQTDRLALPKATLYASGSLGALAGPNAKVSPPAQVHERTGTVIGVILDAAGWPAEARDIDLGDVPMGHWYKEDVEALGAMREIEDTEQGFLYEGLSWDVAFRRRYDRTLNHATSLATFSDSDGAPLTYLVIGQSDPLRDIYNEVVVAVQPLLLDVEAVLWKLSGQTPVLAPGQSRTYIATASGGDVAYVSSWVTPVVGTDVTQTGVSDGDIAVSVNKTARTMFITLTNNDVSESAIISLLQARGIPVKRYDAYQITASDEDSQADYLKRTYPFPSNWYFNEAYADSAARYIVGQNKDQRPRLTANLVSSTAAVRAQAISRDLSDRVTFEAAGAQTQLGINADFYVESIRHQFSAKELMKTTWELSPAPEAASLFLVEVSELDGTDGLAP